MSICPTNNNTKYKTSYPQTPSDNSKKPKDEPRQQLPKRNPKRVPLDAKRSVLEVQKGSLVERRNYGRQVSQNGHPGKFDGRGPPQNANGRRTDPCLKTYSKKASLNHLLNFKFEPRSRSENFHRQTPRAKSKACQDFEAFSREKFLQANCQFCVSENGNYDVHFVDPDLPVPWDRVERVRVWNEVPSSCPICLYPPFVPKITRCGHIYCWPCILHYLALGDGGSQKCPICHEMVHGKELRSVEEYHDETAVAGGEMTMRLMCCSRSNAVPRSAGDIEVDASESEVGRDVKIVKISPLDVLNRIIEMETQQLKDRKLAGDLEPVEMMFVDSAIKESEMREAEVIAAISEDCSNGLSVSETMDAENNSEIQDDVMNTEDEDSNADDKKLTVSSMDQKPKSDKDLYYFYQCEDGRHLYIHGLNIKCLLKEYKDFAHCPKVIQGRILEIEGFTMTQNLRKRHRYLSHLPLMCEFKVVELDLEVPLLSQETLGEFQEQMERRATYRRKKERSETKMSYRLEMIEKRKQDNYLSGRCYAIDTQLGNRTAGGSVSVLISGNQPRTTVSLSRGSPEEWKDNNDTIKDESAASSSSLSFAQMLKSTSPTMPEANYKPRVSDVTSKTALDVANTGIEVDSDDPDYVPPPTYQYSFGNAISEAISRVSVCDHSGTGKATQGKKGRRKKKQTLLFSTSQMHHV